MTRGRPWVKKNKIEEFLGNYFETKTELAEFLEVSKSHLHHMIRGRNSRQYSRQLFLKLPELCKKTGKSADYIMNVVTGK